MSEFLWPEWGKIVPLILWVVKYFGPIVPVWCAQTAEDQVKLLADTGARKEGSAACHLEENATNSPHVNGVVVISVA